MTCSAESSIFYFSSLRNDLLLLENNTDNDLSNKDYKKINFSECLLQIVLCFVTHFYFPKKLRAVDFGS